VPRSAGGALILVFLVAHLGLLPRTLEDLDSINFALGVRHFDVANHQPHPPGYPVFIALAKASTSVLRATGVSAAAPRGLAIWSAIGGSLAIVAVFVFFRRLESRPRLAWWTAFAAACSPLFWFTALRPLSDAFGFAIAMSVLAIASGDPARRRIVAAAALAGLAIGIRTQTAVLTVPFLLLAIARKREGRTLIGSLGAFSAGVLAWAIPLLVASGGLSAYLGALSFQAGADFTGVEMLWTHHGARALVNALLNTFVWPWDWWLGIVVCGLAAIGFVRIALRAQRVLVTLSVAFVPYAVFHLLFQETVTTRYALPLVPLMIYAALAALEGLPAAAMPVAAVGVSVLSLMSAWPASVVYAREGAPAFRAFDDMATTAHGGDRVDAIALHAEMKRASEWAEPIFPATVLRAPHGREWLTLVDLWKTRPSALVWFLADPARSDLAVFDERSRRLARAYRWGFPEPPFVGGARPDNADWYHMTPPSWMLDRGWAVTAEVGGQTARDRLGPHVAPAIAWIKREPQPVAVVLGGRNVGGGGTANVDVTFNGSAVTSFAAPPGFFFKVLTLPAGTSGGTGYDPLAVTAHGGPVVNLEQFDAQPPGVPMFGFDTGWQEPEFSQAQGRAWRWMSERANLWVRPTGGPVTLHLAGESPRRYFDAAPHVRVLVGDREVSAFDLSSDFDQAIALPADQLAAANGRVVIESSKFFVPAASGAADQRHLALRLFRVSVD
jgi:Protein O-mannosyl-transferase TMEM260-like